MRIGKKFKNTMWGIMAVMLLSSATTGLSAAKYLLHFGGMCSTQYLGGHAQTMEEMMTWQSVNVHVDNRHNIYYSAAVTANRLEQHCSGSNMCYIFNYSAGDAILRRVLSTYDFSHLNIVVVKTSAGAGGGSEIASVYTGARSIPANIATLGISSFVAWLSDKSGTSCNMTNYLDVDSVRAAWGAGRWAFDDTSGHTIYHIAGRNAQQCNWGWGSFWGPYYTCLAKKAAAASLLPGQDDGAVAFHSALGRADVGGFNDFWHKGIHGNYYGHYATRDLDLDHAHMKPAWYTTDW